MIKSELPLADFSETPEAAMLSWHSYTPAPSLVKTNKPFRRDVTQNKDNHFNLTLQEAVEITIDSRDTSDVKILLQT